MACVILSDDTFKYGRAVRLRTTKAGAATLIGIWWHDPTGGCYRATACGVDLQAPTRKGLRDEIERTVDGC